MASSEESHVSESEIKDYKEKFYGQLISGKYRLKNSNGTFRCPFCAGKRKQEYHKKDLLQHASGVGVGSYNRSIKQKANHLALSKFLRKNLSGKDSTEPATEQENQNKLPNKDELFVWPWKAIVANVRKIPTGANEATANAHWLRKFSEYKPTEVHLLAKNEGPAGYAILDFSEDWSGFNNSMDLEKGFQANRHGKQDWLRRRRHQDINLYGWCARADDYYTEGPIGNYLRQAAALKTILNIIEEATEGTSLMVKDLASKIDVTNENIDDLKHKVNEKSIFMKRMLEETDKIHKVHNEEMEKMQRIAQDHAHRIIEESAKLKYELECKREQITRRCKELTEREALTAHERKLIQIEIQEKSRSLHLASEKQQKASNNVLRLLEEQKREKKEALGKILELEKELNSKQKLLLEIEKLRGQLKVLEHQRNENDTSIQKKMEIMEEELKDKMEELEGMEDLSLTLIVKEREMNDQLQAARKEMITGLTGMLRGRTTIGIKRMGELSAKPFLKECKKRYPASRAMEEAALLCSEWQEYIQDPGWYPFKVIEIEGKGNEEVLDPEDEKLKELKQKWGKDAHEAVVTALKEMNDYNPSGRYIVPELWNFQKERKATLREVISYILDKTPRKRRRRG